MRFDINGLVLRETPVGDNASYIDVLTAEAGRMSVFARGVRSPKSKNRAATLPMSYSEFTLERGKPDFTVLCEAKIINAYGDSKNDIEVGALSMYIIEILREFSLPDTPQEALLQLGLNTLYAISARLYPLDAIKAAFEMRVMADEGYAPDLSGCAYCRRSDTDDMYLDVMNGALRCGDCLAARPDTRSDEGTATILLPVSRGTVEAMRYVAAARPARLFSFKLEDRCLPEFSSACERYLINHLERDFPTLDFWRQVTSLTAATRKIKEEKDSNG